MKKIIAYFLVFFGLTSAYGQRILDQLVERYKGQTCVLDMESPYQQPCDNIEQRKRRHEFYLRNGFRDTDVIAPITTLP